MTERASSAAVLGSADGFTTAIGIIVTAIAANSHQSSTLLHVTIRVAVAAAVSMGGGEWLSQDATDWRKVGAMSAGTFIGFAPALAWLSIGPLAGIAVALVVVGVTAWVRSVLRGERGWRRLRTVAMVLLVLCVAVGAAMLLGVAG